MSLSAGCRGTAIALAAQECSVIAIQLPPPQITVIESVVNSYFGTSTASDFTVAVKGSGASPASFIGNASRHGRIACAGEI